MAIPATKSAIRLERRDDEQLWLCTATGDTCVRVVRCFPWTHRDELLSLRDAGGRQVALIGSAAELDEASRSALTRALRELDLLIEIIGIESIDEEIEIRCWSVQTALGPRSFQTRRDDWPERSATGTIMIRDLSGDLYAIRDPGRMDAASRARLAAYVDLA